jgi:hypothetical protein
MKHLCAIYLRRSYCRRDRGLILAVIILPRLNLNTTDRTEVKISCAVYLRRSYCGRGRGLVLAGLRIFVQKRSGLSGEVEDAAAAVGGAESKK